MIVVAAEVVYHRHVSFWTSVPTVSGFLFNTRCSCPMWLCSERIRFWALI